MSRESKILIGILIAIVGGMIALFMFANRDTSGPAPVGDKTKIVRDNSHQTGSGPVQLVEFGDFQCPACGATHPVIKQLLQDYNGKITFYFRNFPLTNIHKNALASAQAAEAAGDQGKYWEMYDKLYDGQKDWSELTSSDAAAKYTDYAKDLGLDVNKFSQALSNGQFKTIVDQDAADATALNLQATPTFFINGTQYTGKTDYPSLRDAVQAELTKLSPSPSPAP